MSTRSQVVSSDKHGLLLKPDTVYVWHALLNTAISPYKISKAEQEKALKFSDKKEQRYFLRSRTILRTVLGQCLQTDPEKIHWEHNPSGKPEFKNNPIHFNLSHSKTHFVLAVSKTLPIGIDTEYRRPFSKIDTVSKRFFTPQEHEQLTSLTNITHKKHLFFKLWCQKEAIAKAQGLSLFQTLQYSPTTDWHLHEINFRPHFQTTLAYQSREKKKIEIIDYHSFSESR